MSVVDKFSHALQILFTCPPHGKCYMHIKFWCACNQSPRFPEDSFQNMNKSPLRKRQKGDSDLNGLF